MSCQFQAVPRFGESPNIPERNVGEMGQSSNAIYSMVDVQWPCLIAGIGYKFKRHVRAGIEAPVVVGLLKHAEHMNRDVMLLASIKHASTKFRIEAQTMNTNIRKRKSKLNRSFRKGLQKVMDRNFMEFLMRTRIFGQNPLTRVM